VHRMVISSAQSIYWLRESIWFDQQGGHVKRREMLWSANTNCQPHSRNLSGLCMSSCAWGSSIWANFCADWSAAKLHPVTLYVFDNNWHSNAKCELRQAMRYSMECD
jgi:hypothetical protein